LKSPVIPRHRGLATTFPSRDDADMRCFVAVKPSPAVCGKIALAQEELRRAGADVRWIGPGELHVTLRFFGDLDAAVVARLRTTLARAAAAQPKFRIAYKGLGEFPNVVWVGGSQGADALAAAVEGAAAELGLPKDRYGFTAHLTIGRIRSQRGAQPLAAAIAALRGRDFGEDEIAEFSLIQSTLTPRGPVYEVVEVFALRPGP
jgi:2'-5' RNA ligase